MNRAYSLLTIKSFDEDERIFEGFATTPDIDRDLDIIEPLGGTYSLPLPLLRGHNSDKPVGEVFYAQPTPAGVLVRGRIPKIDEPGPTRDRVDEAWGDIRHGLIRGLSVGIIPRKQVPIKGSRGVRVTEWEWMELSLVTLPSNVKASITMVKSYDEGAPAAIGTVTDVEQPGASGRVSIIKSPEKPKGKMTNTEQVQQFTATRASKLARLNELTKKAGTEGMTLDATESEEFDTLDKEIDAINVHLSRLSRVDTLNKSAATPVGDVDTIEKAAGVRAGEPIVTVKSREEKGIGFARYVMCLASAKGNRFEAAQLAEQRYGDQAQPVVAMLKAAVAAGTTTDATWAAPLVPTTNLTNDFLELLRPATIIGRLPGVRKVPFNISMPTQTGGGTYGWVGQGSAKPLTSAAFAAVTLGFAKAAGIIVLSKELVKFSNPNAEQVVRDEMIAGIGAFLDVQFTDPAVAAVANVNPASITNGIAGTVAGGTTEAFARSDLRALLGGFVTGNFGLGGVVLLMNEGVAFTLSTMVNAVGEPAFPGLSATGGSLAGVQVVTSNAITAATGIIAVHAPSVLLADDGGVEIDASEQASLQMDSAPSNPTDATTVMVSLWQRNLIGLRAERFINWKLARTDAVRRIHTVAYA